ncbi:hypothetical protein L1987_34463 [Smallanthus sonchifolius]|uniref:Uncharacterized protein n=2 Tax=Smallanthus sonchifolius TaxID=185202 RepID=A0ACB9HV41_9ASTR|nr:hypothetical protein L1987_34459 [Smallanthus sonchifolius]KAI3799173.1 hypothetical protein L1987_34463 [Smallanthus sonchifolius]
MMEVDGPKERQVARPGPNDTEKFCLRSIYRAIVLREEKIIITTMEASNKIEHEIGGLKNDALRFGLQGVKSDIVGSHPLESAFQSAIVREEQMKRKILANTYGSAFPLRQEFDRKILSRFQRPPGLIPSSMLGLESHTGALEDFGVEDYLQDVHDTETMRAPDLHHGMEVRVGLSKGPVHPSFM